MDQKKENPPVDEAKKQTMLLAQLVEILMQNAVMMLGMMPDRQGRQRPPDLAGAEMMIDMLSVLHKKTKGNLTPEEEKLLNSALYQLQTAFAEIASKSGDFSRARKATEAAEEEDADAAFAEEPPPSPARQAAPGSPSAPKAPTPTGKVTPVVSTENKVKFSKKYE